MATAFPYHATTLGDNRGQWINHLDIEPAGVPVRRLDSLA